MAEFERLALLVSDSERAQEAADTVFRPLADWVPLDEARALDLPFITEVVLAELKAGTDGPPPWFRDDDEVQLMTRLNGTSPLA